MVEKTFFKKLFLINLLVFFVKIWCFGHFYVKKNGDVVFKNANLGSEKSLTTLATQPILLNSRGLEELAGSFQSRAAQP